MRTSGQKIIVALLLFTALYGSTISVLASTEDNGKSEPSAKPAAAKVDAPAPLTERERWLLDRVEQLEKRVADLESKTSNTASSARDGSAAAPASLNAATSAIAAAAPYIAPRVAPANSDSASNEDAAGV